MLNFLHLTLANPERCNEQHFELADGTRVDFIDTGILHIAPILPDVFSPHVSRQKCDTKIVISCGLHGNETAPIEIIDELVNEIFAGKFKVNNELLFIIGNPSAINANKRLVDENLNRLFSARHNNSQTLEAKRAAQLERVITTFYQQRKQSNQLNLHYDLHTAIRGSKFEKFAVVPYLHERSLSETQLGFLEQCGIEAVVLSNQPSGTFSYFTSHEFAAHSFTVELGKVRPFGSNNMQNFKAITHGLRQLISGEENFQSLPRNIHIFEVVKEVIKRTSQFKLHIEPQAENFTQVPQGALLASDQNYEYRAQQTDERFVFPISNVPIGQRAMLVVAPITSPISSPVTAPIK